MLERQRLPTSGTTQGDGRYSHMAAPFCPTGTFFRGDHCRHSRAAHILTLWPELASPFMPQNSPSQCHFSCIMTEYIFFRGSEWISSLPIEHLRFSQDSRRLSCEDVKSGTKQKWLQRVLLQSTSPVRRCRLSNRLTSAKKTGWWWERLRC